MTTQNGKRNTRGYIQCAEFNYSTACYVAGYTAKKIKDLDTFSLCSKRPGIGRDWLEKYKSEVLRNGSVIVEGKELPCPQKYLEWQEDYLFPVKEKRRESVPEDGRLTDRQLIAKAANYQSINRNKAEKL